MATVLTIYTEKFDSEENVVNGGMSGKAYLDMDNQIGMSFKNVDEALDYCYMNNIDVHMIEFKYATENGVQMFRKFKVEP